LKISDSWLGLMILPGQWGQWMIVFQNPYDLVWVLSKFKGHRIPLSVLHDSLRNKILSKLTKVDVCFHRNWVDFLFIQLYPGLMCLFNSMWV
jgi:hypothetical protein